jgi:hypothetical protein
LKILLEFRVSKDREFDITVSAVMNTSSSLYLILELVTGKDLFHFLSKNFDKAKGGIGILMELFSYQVGLHLTASFFLAVTLDAPRLKKNVQSRCYEVSHTATPAQWLTGT